jgi:hypothetical protein
MEIWKDVPNYNGVYQVSSLGNVRSYFNNRHGLSKTPKLIKQSILSCGYLSVGLKNQNKNKTHCVHSLLAISFLGHKSDGTNKLVIDHIDGNKLNNNIENLQIITNRQNTSKKPRGKNNLIGTSYVKKNGKYMAAIFYNKKQYNLGLYKTELEAHIAYKNKLKSIT